MKLQILVLVFVLSLLVTSCSSSVPSEAEMLAMVKVSEINNNAKVTLTNENIGSPVISNNLEMSFNAVLRDLPANPGILTSDMANIFYKNLGEEKGIEREIVCTISDKEGSKFSQKYTFRDLKNISILESRYNEINTLMTEKRYKEVYNLGSTLFYESMSEAEFLNFMNELDTENGSIASSQFIGWFEPKPSFVTLHGLQKRDKGDLPFLVTLDVEHLKIINVQLGF